ncbi:hypothetical protein RN001_011831 [Aquatica leii]|uniref:Uncharacterized protein n=1 Tax=Aquatica leii TaxID=1421715 RepID=A0AAN7P254_9COLE|nr:hypothetical protein RN001_011831 [Aquatica leii]
MFELKLLAIMFNVRERNLPEFSDLVTYYDNIENATTPAILVVRRYQWKTFYFPNRRHVELLWNSHTRFLNLRLQMNMEISASPDIVVS